VQRVSDGFRAVAVEGIGWWSPRLPGWDTARAVLRGEGDPAPTPAARPASALLPPNERRRAPDTVAVSLEVASRACAHAKRDPARLPCVFASTHGDLAITDAMCETLAGDPRLLSPTRFHNSVHNAAAGYWSIATGCLAPYTALSAWEHTFAAGLLESLVQAACAATPVLYVAYDVQARGPLASMAPSDGVVGAALVLGPDTSRSGMTLHWRIADHPRAPAAQSAARHGALVAGNAMAACLPLFAALAGEARSTLRYAVGPHALLELQLETGR
jgi:hypothetical protein